MDLENQYQFTAHAFAITGVPADLALDCNRCGWAVHVNMPLTLAELNERADTHAEERHR